MSAESRRAITPRCRGFVRFLFRPQVAGMGSDLGDLGVGLLQALWHEARHNHRREAMSVDTKLYLPPYVRLSETADVIGILLGQPHELRPLGNSGGIHCWVDGVVTKSFEPSVGLAGCARIVIDGADRMMWHYRGSPPRRS